MGTNFSILDAGLRASVWAHPSKLPPVNRNCELVYQEDKPNNTGATRWIINDDIEKRVHVAPWVVKTRRKLCSVDWSVSWKSSKDDLLQSESWLDRCWGKIPVGMQLLDALVVWKQFTSEK